MATPAQRELVQERMPRLCGNARCGCIRALEAFTAVLADSERLAQVEQERVICAAVKAEDGSVFYGHRHGDCLRSVHDHGKRPDGRGDSQGFVTTRGRYVTREQGRRLQDAAGIRSADVGGYRGDLLFSEDLYAAGDWFSVLTPTGEPQ